MGSIVLFFVLSLSMVDFYFTCFRNHHHTCSRMLSSCKTSALPILLTAGKILCSVIFVVVKLVVFSNTKCSFFYSFFPHLNFKDPKQNIAKFFICRYNIVTNNGAIPRGASQTYSIRLIIPPNIGNLTLCFESQRFEIMKVLLYLVHTDGTQLLSN